MLWALSLVFPAESRGGLLYSVTNLGDLPDGADSSVATGINASGQVVGYSGVGSGTHTFLWTPGVVNGKTGSMVDLGVLSGGDNISNGMGINSFGQVVGSSNFTVDSKIVQHAFLWTPDIANGAAGSMIDLGNLTNLGGNAEATSINSLGQVTGSGFNGSHPHAFLWTPNSPNGTTGTMIDVGTIGGTSTEHSNAYDINDFGQIVGESGVSVPVGFLWTPSAPNSATGTIVAIDTAPGATRRSTGDHINTSGQIASHVNVSTGFRAFLWTPQSPNGSTGAMLNLGDLLGGWMAACLVRLMTQAML